MTEHGTYQGTKADEVLAELKEIKIMLTTLNSNLQYLIELKMAERDR